MWEATKTLLLILSFVKCNGFFKECKVKSDMIFLIDDSESISAIQFEKVKHFIKRILLPANIDSGDVRIGILIFNSDVRVEFDLNSYTSKREVFEHIDLMTQVTGATNTAEALRVMNEEMFRQEKGDRNNVMNIAVLLTDGSSQTVSKTIQRAKQARLNGIHIFAIGIGDVFELEIREVASMPSIENAFILEGFGHLRSFKNDFLNFCEVVDPRTSCYEETSSETANTTKKVCSVYNVWEIQCKDIAWRNSNNMIVRMGGDSSCEMNCTVLDKMTLTTSIFTHGESNWTAMYSPMKENKNENKDSSRNSTRSMVDLVSLMCLIVVALSLV